MAKQKTNTLPDKPSELIRVALADLVKVERSKKYEVDMGTFHYRADYDLPCMVCFAGAVIAKTMGGDINEALSPYDFGRDAGKLNSLDFFRDGAVLGGLWEFYGREIDYDASHFSPTPYSSDPKQFKKDMRKLARDLEKAGY